MSLPAFSPARLRLPDAAALAQWAAAYKHGYAMQASPTILSGLRGALAAVIYLAAATDPL